MECLFGGIYVDRSDGGSHVFYELVQHLSDTKNIFLDPRLSKSILTQMERLLSKETEEMALTEKHCLLNCITLLRNVLHIPDNSESSTNSNSNRYFVKKSKLSSENTLAPNMKCFFSDKTDSATTESRGSMNGEATSGSGENPTEDDEGSAESGEMKMASNKENGSPSTASRQHQVLWNLFAHNLDSVIMSMIESPNLKTW